MDQLRRPAVVGQRPTGARGPFSVAGQLQSNGKKAGRTGGTPSSAAVTCRPKSVGSLGLALSLLLLAGCAHDSSVESSGQQDQAEPTGSKVADVPFPMSVSPDGRLVTGFFGKAGNLAVRDLASGETRNLTNQPYPELVRGSVFSPNGERIAYSWHNEDDFDDLRVIGLDGSDPQILYRDPRGRSVAVKDWSPDGEQLLITVRREDLRGEIASVAISDGSLRRLATGVILDELPERMAFSSDGRFIAYDVRVGEGPLSHDIFLIERDETRPVPLVEHASDDVLLGWSPDGAGILFASDRGGDVDIWFLPVANRSLDGTPTIVRRSVGALLPLGFSQDGSYYYGVTGCDCGVYVAELDAETSRLVGAPQRLATAIHRSGVDWSPDGGRLSYLAPAGGVLADAWVLVERSVGSENSRTYSVPVWVLHQLRPLWSPDGRFVLVKGWDSRAYPREVVYSVAVGTGEIATLVDSPSLWHAGMIDWVDWSADGSALFYVRDAEGPPPTVRIVVRQLKSGREKDLFQSTAPPYFYGLTASRNGRHLAFGVWDPQERRSILKILSIAGGEPQELAAVALPDSISPPSWTVDSRHLIYQTKEGLWRVSIDGGAPSRLGSLVPPANNQAGFRIHPHGQQIAFVAEESRTSEIWVLKNLLSP